jgi:hypothetical protein
MVSVRTQSSCSSEGQVVPDEIDVLGIGARLLDPDLVQGELSVAVEP